MNNVFEGTGKTVEAALTAACEAAGVGLDEVEVDVLDVGSRGFLGLGGKPAKVQVTVQKAQKEEEKKPSSEIHRPVKKSKPTAEVVAPDKAKSEGEAKAVTFDSVQKKEDQPANKTNKEVKEVKGVAPFGKFISAEQEALAFMEPILAKMKLNPTHESKVKDNILWISFFGVGLGSLIGRRGETINSLQYLTNLIINRGKEEHTRIVFDVEGYRKSRKKTLHNLARKMADQAVRSGRRLELDPMNPHERRIIHMALQDDKRVDTLSCGDEPYRRIVIVKKRKNK
ncbi:MAG: RNA-binding cell elongation regulator Jag/EloR [Bacillota bacterium]|jgi:spoIIIJ-associated protein